jgi:hypothetical protein
MDCSRGRSSPSSAVIIASMLSSNSSTAGSSLLSLTPASVRGAACFFFVGGIISAIMPYLATANQCLPQRRDRGTPPR